MLPLYGPRVIIDLWANQWFNGLILGPEHLLKSMRKIRASRGIFKQGNPLSNLITPEFFVYLHSDI